MSPVTHLLASWCLAEASGLEDRDRAIIAWAGVAPDLDGLGIVADTACRLAGWAGPGLYEAYHHVLFHGLWGALLFSVAGAAMARRRLRTFLWAMAAVHLHLVCDLAGSRGPGAGHVWAVEYLSPASRALTFSWAGQWPLNGWPNVLFTAALMAFVFWRAAGAGRSPASLVSRRAHEAFVAAVRGRMGRMGSSGGDGGS